MGAFYLMETDNFCDYGVIENPEIDDDISFLAGQSIDIVLPTLAFEVNFPKKAFPPHLLGDETPLISNSLLKMLQNAGINNFQTFPAHLTNPKNKQSWSDYLAFNVIGMVQAANLDRSDYDVLMDGDNDTPPLLAFREIVLEAEKIPANVLMFRMTEAPDNLIVHKKLVELLAKNRPNGGWGIDVIELELA
jgi:hypothetical protein